MKEKKYFYDWLFPANKACWETGIKLLIIGIISFFISYNIIYYNFTIPYYEEALNSYDADAYEYLYEIAENCIVDGKGIVESAIPEDVIEYDIHKTKDGITFKYILGNNEGIELASQAVMSIELSNSYEILSQKPNYSSEEEYVKVIKGRIKYNTSFLAVLTAGVILLIILFIAAISEKKKKKNQGESNS